MVTTTLQLFYFTFDGNCVTQNQEQNVNLGLPIGALHFKFTQDVLFS